MVCSSETSATDKILLGLTSQKITLVILTTMRTSNLTYFNSNLIMLYRDMPAIEPSGLRHVLSSLARTLGSLVRIPLRAWMFGVCMCLFCICVFLCLGRGLATSWSLVQGVLPYAKIIMKLKRGQGTWGLYSKQKNIYRCKLKVVEQ
jgi:hypothetical protein